MCVRAPVCQSVCCVFMRVRGHLRVCASVCVRVWTHAYAQTHTQIDVHTHIYTQTDVNQYLLNMRGFIF